MAKSRFIPSYRQWLRQQQSRDDSVGLIARYWARRGFSKRAGQSKEGDASLLDISYQPKNPNVAASNLAWEEYLALGRVEEPAAPPPAPAVQPAAVAAAQIASAPTDDLSVPLINDYPPMDKRLLEDLLTAGRIAGYFCPWACPGATDDIMGWVNWEDDSAGWRRAARSCEVCGRCWTAYYRLTPAGQFPPGVLPVVLPGWPPDLPGNG